MNTDDSHVWECECEDGFKGHYCSFTSVNYDASKDAWDLEDRTDDGEGAPEGVHDSNTGEAGFAPVHSSTMTDDGEPGAFSPTSPTLSNDVDLGTVVTPAPQPVHIVEETTEAKMVHSLSQVVGASAKLQHGKLHADELSTQDGYMSLAELERKRGALKDFMSTTHILPEFSQAPACAGGQLLTVRFATALRPAGIACTKHVSMPSQVPCRAAYPQRPSCSQAKGSAP